MKNHQKLLCGFLYGMAAVSALVLIHVVWSEVEANRIAAQWAAAGYPDLRANHTTVFLSKALAAAGAALLSCGLALRIGPEKRPEDQTKRETKKTPAG